MEIANKRRPKIRLILFGITAFCVLLTAFIVSHCAYRRLSRELNAARQRSLAQLDSYIASINSDLTKGLYVNTQPMLENMAAELTRDAAGAKSALSALPVSDVSLDNTYKFLSQVGAFVTSLERQISSGGNISVEQREQLKKLITISQSLSNSISSVIENVEAGELSLQKSASNIAKSDAKAATLATELTSAEEAVSDYPTLIYDGPFSDSILSKESEMLRQAGEVTREQALENALKFCSLKGNELQFTGEMDGKIPSYLFADEGLTVAVSKRGGYIVYLLSSANAGEVKITEKQAIENARKFLENNGYLYMEESYYSTDDGICTVNFALNEYGVTCYPDLIKVSVSLDSGNIVSYDASGFIMNHTARQFDEPKISEDEARKSVSPLLQVMSSKRAVIPTSYETEQDTYEFHCKSESGQEFLVYIDTETGFEDDILILLYSDNGILTK